jgi:hypothetical protein
LLDPNSPFSNFDSTSPAALDTSGSESWGQDFLNSGNLDGLGQGVAVKQEEFNAEEALQELERM